MILFKKTTKSINVFAILVILMFVVVISIMIISMIKEYSFYRNSEKVTGVISNIKVISDEEDSTYKFYVSYTTLDGQEFNDVLAKYDGGLSGTEYIGTDVTVYYNKSNPTEVGLVGYSRNILYIFIVIIFGSIVTLMVYRFSKI